MRAAVRFGAIAALALVVVVTGVLLAPKGTTTASVDATPVSWDFATYCHEKAGGTYTVAQPIPENAGFGCSLSYAHCKRDAPNPDGDGILFLRRIALYGSDGYTSDKLGNQMFPYLDVCVTDGPADDGKHYAVVFYGNQLASGTNCDTKSPGEGTCYLAGTAEAATLSVASGAGRFVDWSPDPARRLDDGECLGIGSGQSASFPVCTLDGIWIKRGTASGLVAEFYAEMDGPFHATEEPGYVVAVQLPPSGDLTLGIEISNNFRRAPAGNSYWMSEWFEYVWAGSVDVIVAGDL